MTLPRHRLTRSQVAALPRGSAAEILLAEQLRQAGFPSWQERYSGWEREVTFIEGRRFRADFLWAQQRLIVEIEGGGYVNGRHSRGAGMEADCEKSALAAIRGYRVMRVTPRQVNDGSALAWIRRALERAA